MFGRKKKQKYLDDLREVLISLGNTSNNEVDEFISEYRDWILSETYDRDLEPILGAWNIGEKSMERIFLAHQLKKYDEADVVPRFMFLVALKSYIGMKSAQESTGGAIPSTYLVAILDLPVAVEKPDVTYKDLIKSLQDANPEYFDRPG